MPQHVLRFWETKFAQVRPLKRGGGRRYYRPEDIELLRRIRQLLYGEGYTIKGVQKLLREGGARPQETAEVEPEIVKDTNKLQSILDDLIEIRNLLRNG
ncbi:DNA-binding transcriptional regulator, MerR family [Tistlia consotensis]|uniref:DNA-binding transcriptional regulator, MerR family n=1 Tax=Tistlia consotensis USBA 355 TaxID=560819 RepID=A0A1Y6C9M6_9PROT|nr:DNA-binding transcriptional regulator, MerR family [Tistlia consotensis USBA 355]SNR42580.1 DNA-binding transcriptional regulator, MerR family [Tistlia consotensis]